MRTRIYNKCTNEEVEEYFRRGKDTLIVAVGTVELHGQLPMDCEAALAEGFALKVAEKTDSLAAINLPYFCAGATAIGRGTFNISVEDGVHYLMAVMRSFYRQGFRNIMMVSCHGPAYLTLNTTAMDFFLETKDPILHCEMMHAMQIAKDNGWDPQEDFNDTFNDLIYGAYDALGRLEDIPVSPDVDLEKLAQERDLGNRKQAMKNDLHKVGFAPGSFGSFYYTKAQHGMGEACLSEAERRQRGAKGAKLLTELVDYFDPQRYLDGQKELDDQVNNEILKMYPHLAK